MQHKMNKTDIKRGQLIKHVPRLQIKKFISSFNFFLCIGNTANCSIQRKLPEDTGILLENGGQLGFQKYKLLLT